MKHYSSDLSTNLLLDSINTKEFSDRQYEIGKRLYMLVELILEIMPELDPENNVQSIES